MDARSALPQDGLTVRQDRGKLVLIALGALAFVALGASFALRPELWETVRYSRGAIRVVGWICTPFFAAAFGAAVVLVVRPSTVRLTPAALIVSTPWSTRSRPWSDLDDFRIQQVRRTRVIVFNDAEPANSRLAGVNRRISGATSSLPNALDVDPEQLLLALKAAKARWALGLNALDPESANSRAIREAAALPLPDAAYALHQARWRLDHELRSAQPPPSDPRARSAIDRLDTTCARLRAAHPQINEAALRAALAAARKLQQDADAAYGSISSDGGRAWHDGIAEAVEAARAKNPGFLDETYSLLLHDLAMAYR